MTTTEQPGAGAIVDAQNPWPGLHPFDESAQQFFNGRHDEALELRHLVPQAPLTLLFGASGLGKTSLLKAGLFPLLRKNHFLPIYVHLDVTYRGAPLLEQAKAALQEQIDALRIDAPALPPEASLWEYLHLAGLELWSPQNQLLTPVFVLDQFEEVFTLGAGNPAAIARLRIDLADLIENRLPASLVDKIQNDESAGTGLSLNSHGYKVLLSFREDFLPALEGEPRHREGWRRELPSIQRNRLRLLPMSSEQAFEAVHTTATHLVDETLARRIVRFVAASDETPAEAEPHDDVSDLTVEPALLSLVCHGLNERRKALGKPVFDETLLRSSGRTIIGEFYDDAVAGLPDHVQRFIEDDLITEHGFRKPCDLDDALSVHGITEAHLRSLVDKRLLRIEPQRGTNRVELTHDLLTPIVRERRDRQRARARAQKQHSERVRKWRRALGLAAVTILLAISASLIPTVMRSRQLSDADATRKRAQVLALEHKYDEAQRSLVSALTIYQKHHVANSQISTLIEIGDLFVARQQFKDADYSYQNALQASKAARDRSLEGKALESLASFEERRKDLSTALSYYDQALQAYQDASDHQASGRVLERLGTEAERSRDGKRAVESFAGALRSYTSAGDQISSVRVQQSLERLLGRWGFLVDLQKPQIYELKSDTITLGRDIPGIHNEISFSDKPISRRQLVISRDGQLDDLRSLNGTTLNARVLRYGIPSKFVDGDIIVLANVQALQFKDKRPTAPVSLPTEAWAIFVDGNSKHYSYLTAPEYSLQIKDEALVLAPGSTESAVLKLRRLRDTTEMLAVSPGCQLMTTIKSSDYRYDTMALKTDIWMELLDVPLVCFSADDASAQSFPFQVVLLPSVL